MSDWLKELINAPAPSRRAEVESLVINGDLPGLRTFMAEGVDILLQREPDELTSLQLAASEGHRDLVAWLLSPEVHADVRARRNNSFTALHAAAMKGHTDILKLLLDAGAEVDAQTQPQGYAALHSAAFGGHMEAVQLLLSAGASTEFKNYRDETADETARRQGHLEVANAIAFARELKGRFNDDQSPAVTLFKWGRIELAGGRKFKDVRLFPGGAEEWDWNEHGTRHRPGTQPEDVADLLVLKPTTVILSRGVNLVLQICPETLEILKARGIPAHVLQSEEAVRLYNKLRETERVVALIHSTC